MVKYILLIMLVSSSNQVFSSSNVAHENDRLCQERRMLDKDDICLFYYTVYHPQQTSRTMQNINRYLQQLFKKISDEQTTWLNALAVWERTLMHKKSKAVEKIKEGSSTFNEVEFDTSFNNEIKKFHNKKIQMKRQAALNSHQTYLLEDFLTAKKQLKEQMMFLAAIVEVGIYRRVDAIKLARKTVPFKWQVYRREISPIHSMQWYNLGFSKRAL